MKQHPTFSGFKVIGKLIFFCLKNQSFIPISIKSNLIRIRADIKIILAILIQVFCIANCNTESSPSDTSKNEISLLKSTILYQNSQISQLGFQMNGTWNSYTEGVSTSSTKTYITSYNGKGTWLDDSSEFGGFSTCKIIVQYDQTSGILITQNPPNNGACFSNDTNKGKYSKTIYFLSSSKYYYCETNYGKSNSSEALSATYKADKTNLLTGCGDLNSPWSRLEKVE